jgi:hypothetical protein
MKDYHLQEMARGFSAWLNTLFDLEGDDIADFTARQAKLIEKVAHAYPKAILEIRPEYGFHLDTADYEKVSNAA